MIIWGVMGILRLPYRFTWMLLIYLTMRDLDYQTPLCHIELVVIINYPYPAMLYESLLIFWRCFHLYSIKIMLIRNSLVFPAILKTWEPTHWERYPAFVLEHFLSVFGQEPLRLEEVRPVPVVRVVVHGVDVGDGGVSGWHVVSGYVSVLSGTGKKEL